jgi:hypothetical protein
MNKGALFLDNKKYRLYLYRIWDSTKDKLMFIGLNPSTADETNDDPTIRKVIGFARANGYGGVYMCNCFPVVSTDPKGITTDHLDKNDLVIAEVSDVCDMVVFAWGNFKEPILYGRDQKFKKMFPYAVCLGKNKNGSPKHPLYVSYSKSFEMFAQ